MKTITCQKPGELTLIETKMPEPKQGEALVRIRNIGICGTDLHAYKGRQPFFEYPRILGHELAAEVVDPGNSAGLNPGDPVVINPYLNCGRCIACRRGKGNCCQSLQVMGVHCDGGMREFLALPTENLLPADGLSLDQMATVECLTIGAHAVRRAELAPEETVAVVGTGPIGIGVIQFARKAGARIIAMDIQEERLKYCRNILEVEATVNALEKPVEALLDLTGGDKPTTVFEATGNKASMEQAFQYVSHGGQLVFVGLVKDQLSIDNPHFHKHELTLKSSRNSTPDDLRHVIDSMREGGITTSKFITHRSTFEEMIGQFDSWLLPETGVIKAMVEIA